jgi:hypothetical protein
VCLAVFAVQFSRVVRCHLHCCHVCSPGRFHFCHRSPQIYRESGVRKRAEYVGAGAKKMMFMCFVDGPLDTGVLGSVKE